MPADISQRQRQLQQQQQQIQSDIETQRSSAEMYEEGSTLDNDKAIRMQEHTGQAIQDLIDQLGVIEEHITELDGMEQENLEELDVDIDRTQQIKDGDDGDDGLTDDDPWAQVFLGGDDEPIQIRRKIKRKRYAIVLEDEDIQEDKKAAVNLPVVEDLLPTPEQENELEIHNIKL